MKRFVPWALVSAALGASCTLDLAGKPDESSGSAASTGSTGGAGATATATSSTDASSSGVGVTSGAGGAGGTTVSVSASVSASVSTSVSASVSSSASSSTGTGGGPVWTRLRELDLDCGFNGHVDDFAVLVLLKTGRIDYTATQNKGQDLRFTDLSDQALDHEIERWDESGVSVVWVRVPAIDQNGGTHTKIRMYYGNMGAGDAQNAKGLWGATYAGVWHLSQGNNALADSSGHTALATNHGSTSLPSIVGDGRDFDAASSQYIDTHNSTQVDLFTVEAWVKGNHNATTGNGPNGALMREKNYQIMWDHINPFDAAASLNTEDNNPNGQNWKAAGFTGLNSNTWYYLAATFTGDALRAYRDGVLKNTTTFPSTKPQMEGETAKIGRHAFGTASANFFDGMVDEVRISTQVRTDSWIKAQNKSMRDSAFVTFGGEQMGSYTLP